MDFADINILMFQKITHSSLNNALIKKKSLTMQLIIYVRFTLRKFEEMNVEYTIIHWWTTANYE